MNDEHTGDNQAYDYITKSPNIMYGRIFLSLKSPPTNFTLIYIFNVIHYE